ncbi:MAG: aldehyde ferredoxin oxidoreductase family protein [Chloroflexota bacterium]
MTKKLYGYAGEVLQIDLSTGKVEKTDTEAKMARKFMGGIGYGAKTLYDEVGNDVSPFSPENIIVFSPGALTGTRAPASARVEVTTKSPLTEIIGTGNTGGFWGVALKRAGYDAIVVRGEAEKPVSLIIDDDGVELRDASNLWGKDTFQVTDTLKTEMGGSRRQPVSVMAIGTAGENRVRYACAVNDYYHVAARCGAGAVMGAKKLKAIAVRGTGRVEVASPEDFEAAVRQARDRVLANPVHAVFRKTASLGAAEAYSERGSVPGKNYQTGFLPRYVETRGKEVALKYITGPRGACFGCPVSCFNLAEVNEGKYAGLKISSGTFVSTINTWGGNCAIEDLPAIYKCKETCHLLGMDYGSAAGTIAFAMELYQRGIINQKDTDGLTLDWGDDGVVLRLLDKIARREGFGNLLAEGSHRAAMILGKAAEPYSMSIKGLEMIWSDPRGGGKGEAFGFLTCPRGGDNIKSTHGRMDRINSQWLPDEYDMFPEARSAIYGEPPYRSPSTWEGKPAMVKWFEDLDSVINSLGICLFLSNSILAIGPHHLSRLFSTATGWDISPQEIMKMGERVFTVLKAYNVREGLTREDDRWPERFYNTPLPEGPARGAVIPRELVEQKLDEYYRSRDWDIDTGLPTRPKLEALGLEDIADDLGRLGKLP